VLLSIETQQNPFPHLNPTALDEMTTYQFPPEDIIKAACPTASARRDDLPVAESTQTTEKKTRKRSEMSNEGKEVWEMTEEELHQLNEKWVYWMNKLEHTLSWYAWRDEDLTQIGIINLRRTLCEDINAPPNHLLHRAKFAIWMAASKGRSVDSKKSDKMNQRTRKGGIKVIYTDGYKSRSPYDNPLLANEVRCRPDVLAIDQVAYKDFRASLKDEESTLLDIMIQTRNNGKKGQPAQKKTFIAETSSTYSNYEALQMSLLQKFYHHYGTDEQKEDFARFYRHWRPRTPMYHGRSRRAIAKNSAN